MKADIFYNMSEDGFSHMQTYSSEDGYSDTVTKEELDSKVSTMAWSPCQHVSIWVCAYHCTIWGLAGGWIAGASYGVICSYAFSYAC